MRIVIIEDEWAAYEQLCEKLRKLIPQVSIYPQLQSARAAASFFSQDFPYDLIMADIYLADSTSFEFFNSQQVSAPVIFTTGHNGHMADALAYNSIDYLLKPVKTDDLKRALAKYESFRHFFLQAADTVQPTPAVYRKRIMARKGTEFKLIDTEDVAYFFTENKVLYVVDQQQQKYLCVDNNLSALYEELDPALFFKANRKFVVHLRYLDRFHTDHRSRIVLQMKLPHATPVVISQENAAMFRQWVEQ